MTQPAPRRTCTKCGEAKLLRAFGPGTAHVCHTCKDRVKHNAMLLRTYGITGDEYDAILVAQNGCCSVCGKAGTGSKRWLSVDHDHKTKRVRGLLHAACNRLLGYARDDPQRLRSAAAYLETPPAHNVLPLEHVVLVQRDSRPWRPPVDYFARAARRVQKRADPTKAHEDDLAAQRIYNRARYAADPVAARAKALVWRTANREAVIARQRARRADPVYRAKEAAYERARYVQRSGLVQ
jgi:hypothetical protein